MKEGIHPKYHTIKVVMSPNALQAPPALAATTMLMKPRLTKRALRHNPTAYS